ncbi:MAG TPA: zinc ribbon domain-containing protein [Gaiellaceae bacterium]
MPIYEYKCPNGHVFELFHGIHEPSPEVCPTCGEGPVIRVLHPVAVHFKGSGFYSTDYGRARKTGRDGDKPDKSDSGDTKDKKDKKEPEKKAPAAEAS